MGGTSLSLLRVYLCPLIYTVSVTQTHPFSLSSLPLSLPAEINSALHCGNTLVESDLTLSAELQLCRVSSPALSFAAQLDPVTVWGSVLVHLCVHRCIMCPYICVWFVSESLPICVCMVCVYNYALCMIPLD